MTRTQGQGPAGEKGYPGEKGYFSAGYTTLRMPALFRRTISFAVKTPSDEGNDSACPSSKEQFELANLLAGELRELGIEDVVVSEKCFVYTLSVGDFSHLAELRGRTLLTSDGTTILGVDDKAGIAEIMGALERVLRDGTPHGALRIAFTPDEEIGTGAGNFDVEHFDADVAYTMDGDAEGEIQYQNFNACEADFEVRGVRVHPGSAKGIMVNAMQVCCDINNMLPTLEAPRYTEGYEGFYHLLEIHGDESAGGMSYIVRDFDAASFDCRKQTLRHIAKVMNERWGEGTVTLRIKDEYQNMESVIEGCMFTIDNARLACERAGVVPRVTPIRGGTDGCQLSFRGLPCPNLGTGGEGYHGPYEHATVEGINAATDVVAELIKVYAEA